MKKFLIFLAFALFSINSANAYSDYNCVAPYDLSNGAYRFMSTVTGSKFLGEQVAESIIKKEFSKNLKGKLKVNVTSYSIKDLKKGLFKSISIKGKDINMEGISFSQLDLRTMCTFNYISLEDPNNIVFKEDLPLAFTIVLSENDLNETMETVGYKHVISDLNRLGRSFGGLFKIIDTKIKIKDDKIYYDLKVAIPFVKHTQDIVLVSDLKVVRGKVDFVNTQIINESLSIDLRKIDRIVNYINPLDFSLNILENKDARLTVQNINVKDDKINIKGFIIIPQD